MSPSRLADAIDFGILLPQLALDVEASMIGALGHGAVFAQSAPPLEIFRENVSASIRDIQIHPRGQLLQRFLTHGPYEHNGPIPIHVGATRLSDEETALAVRFIYSFMVNSFQGCLAELLALASCLKVMDCLRREGSVPANARLYVADAAQASAAGRPAAAKSADLHILAENGSSLIVSGVAEVKSYSCPWTRVAAQLASHLRRAALGLQVGAQFYSGDNVTVEPPVARIGIFPSHWKLSRSFRFERTAIGRDLHVDLTAPSLETDQIERLSDTDWRITLRWSQEALAEAAYAMTFWYMEKVGEVIYGSGVPTEWSRMTPSESGINAAKMMLYYAIPRARTAREYQRAVALYNTYCFGYALGMNFRDPHGQREMLWPEDLDEIAATGQTQHGCRIA